MADTSKAAPSSAPASVATVSGTQSATSQDGPNTSGAVEAGGTPEGAQDGVARGVSGAEAAVLASPDASGRGDTRIRVLYPSDVYVAGGDNPAITSEESVVSSAQADAIATSAHKSGVRVMINDKVFVPARKGGGK